MWHAGVALAMATFAPIVAPSATSALAARRDYAVNALRRPRAASLLPTRRGQIDALTNPRHARPMKRLILAVALASLAAPHVSAATDCGKLERMPAGMDATTWTNYECASILYVDTGWGRCLRRRDYTRDSSAGCPGSERCCPSESVVRREPANSAGGQAKRAVVGGEARPSDGGAGGVLLLFFGGWFLFGLFGGAIANTKGRPMAGCLMTMIFSLPGLIVVMLMPSALRPAAATPPPQPVAPVPVQQSAVPGRGEAVEPLVPCPYCGNGVVQGETTCHGCWRVVPATGAAAGWQWWKAPLILVALLVALPAVGGLVFYGSATPCGVLAKSMERDTVAAEAAQLLDALGDEPTIALLRDQAAINTWAEVSPLAQMECARRLPGALWGDWARLAVMHCFSSA